MGRRAKDPWPRDETPHHYRLGHFDVRQLTDEDLERMIVERQEAIAAQAVARR